MHYEKFPQPSPADLSEEPIYWQGYNSYWWSLVQGKIGEIAQPALWEDYTPEIEQAIEALALPHEVSALWAHKFDFTMNNGGFSLEPGENQGAWLAGVGWEATWDSINSDNTVHVLRFVPETQFHGMLVRFDLVSTSATRNAQFYYADPATFMLNQLSYPSGTNHWEGKNQLVTATKIGLRLATTDEFTVTLRELTLWGAGVNPFL